MQTSIKITGLQQTLAELKRLDPDLLKQLRQEIKTEPGMVAIASAIKSNAPTSSPLRGMIHNGKTSYAKPRVTLGYRPSGRIGRSGERAIVTISTISPSGASGFEIADMVGRGPNGNSPKAMGMKKKLGNSPSRFVYPPVESNIPKVSQAVMSIIAKYSAKVNVRLRVR